MTATEIRKCLKDNGFARKSYQNRLAYYEYKGLKVFVESKIDLVTTTTDLNDFHDIAINALSDIKNIEIHDSFMVFLINWKEKRVVFFK